MREEQRARQHRGPVTGADGITRARLESGHSRLLATLFGTARVTRCAWRKPATANWHPARAALSPPAGRPGPERAARCLDRAMPKAAHRVCPACESPTTGAEVDSARRVLLCDLCGAVTPFRLLPPLLFLTWASGAGKTTLYRQLDGRVPEAILIDAVLLWSVNPAHDDPASGYRDFRALILHLAERLAANGRPVLVEGTCTPDQYETLGERWYFSKTAYLAVVCEDETLRRRLAARPDWRRGRPDLEPMVQLNQAFRHQRLDPAPSLLDTTTRSVQECAAELHDWIRLQVADYARTHKAEEQAPRGA